MAAFADILQILVELLLSAFGQFSVPPLNPDTRAAAESEDNERFEGERFEVDIPAVAGKMSFAAEERRTEIVTRLALSEEAIVAGLFAKAREWAETAECAIQKKFPKFKKRIKIAITEIRANGDITALRILTIDARGR